MLHLILVGIALAILGRIMAAVIHNDSASAGTLAIGWVVLMLWQPALLLALCAAVATAWAAKHVLRLATDPTVAANDNTFKNSVTT